MKGCFIMSRKPLASSRQRLRPAERITGNSLRHYRPSSGSIQIMANRNATHGVVRYAVVGQGYIAQAAVLPAFAHAKRNSRLAALVSGDATKRRGHGRINGVDLTYSYDVYVG